MSRANTYEGRDKTFFSCNPNNGFGTSRGLPRNIGKHGRVRLRFGSGPTTETIGGTVVGLLGTGMVLQDNGGDNLTITANGVFTFATAVTGVYDVTMKTQPTSPTQTCSVLNGAGTATANITTVQINCAKGLTVGGSVSGLIGSGLVLQNNGGDNFNVSGTGNVTFTFSSPILPGSNYAVTISSQPTRRRSVMSPTALVR